jgi:hypothetical protein
MHRAALKENKMKRPIFLGVASLLLACVVSQSASLTSVVAADTTAPKYDQQPGINRCTDDGVLPCYDGADDSFTIYMASCSASITNFCYTATVDNQPAPSTLQFVAYISAAKTNTPSASDYAGYESAFTAYYVAPGGTLNKREMLSDCCWVPPNQTSGDGKVDLTSANIEGKVIKVVMKYKTVSLPQNSVVVADDGNMEFDLVGEDLTVTAEGKAARVAVDSAAQHINFDTEKSEDTSLPWTNRCGIPSRNFLVCNVDRAATDGLMFFGKSKTFSFPPGSTNASGVWVSHNATYFHFPKAEPVNGVLQVSVATAAPHYLADGTTLNEGKFNAFLPNAILKQWGLEKTEAKLKASLSSTVTRGTTEEEVVPELVITDDGVKVKFPKISFSAPVIAVKNKPPTSVVPKTTVTTPAVTTPAVVTKTLRRGKSVSLTSLLKPIGKGKQTWSSSGGCKIKGKNLVAPKKAARCKVTLKQAKSGKTKATSRSITVKVN